MIKVSRRHRIILEVFLMALIIVSLAYSLVSNMIGVNVDFPVLYEWKGDYLDVHYLLGYETQPLVVVVENTFYRGDIVEGGLGSCKAFNKFPVQLVSERGAIISNEDNSIRLRYLGKEKVLNPKDVWYTELQRIEYIPSFQLYYFVSYSTRVEYLGITNTVGKHQYQEKFPVITITTSTHVQPLPFLNIFNTTGQIIFVILFVAALINGRYIIKSKKEVMSPPRKQMFCLSLLSLSFCL